MHEQVSKAADDPYAQTNMSRPATAGVSLGPGAAAQAAVLNAAALAGPVVIRCELCQVRLICKSWTQFKPCKAKKISREFSKWTS